MKPRTGKQVKSGLRLGAGIGLFLVAVATLGFVLDRVNDAAPGHLRFWPGGVIAGILIALSVGILVLTARVWILYIGGCLLFAVEKSLMVIANGRSFYSPHEPFPRLLAAEVGLFSMLSLFLIYRLTVSHKPVMFDRFAFTLFTFAFVFGCSQHSLGLIALWHLAGLAVLCFTWLLSPKRSHKQAIAL